MNAGSNSGSNGGSLIAHVLERHGVRHLFTLCGGHISPILVECKRRGLRVVDTRHEVNAVFAADAVARLTGIPGVAAVTAGPGVTNSVTALQNARLAQSPVVLLGGATATVLRGRGALQDIDQLSLVTPLVKWAASARRVRDLPELLAEALWVAQDGVPGPVFLECPVDLLYERQVVESWYAEKSKPGKKPVLRERLLAFYLRRHTARLFRGAARAEVPAPRAPTPMIPNGGAVGEAVARIRKSRRPVLLVGSQATLDVSEQAELVRAIERLGVPVFLAGMARGLLGASHPLQIRHERKRALREADLVLLAGVPADFRLEYGAHVSRQAFLVSVNRHMEDLTRNRRPQLAVLADPGRFLRLLSQALPAVPDGEPSRWQEWLATLHKQDSDRETAIDAMAAETTDGINPIAFFRSLEKTIADDSVLVADGGDFVATASYTVRPRGPLRWLDPGVFGTLGVGAGFALAAKLCKPEAEVWILYGDGSVGFSLAEMDTFVRHGLPVIAVVGNDACWTQIARDQVEILKDDVGCALRRSDYHVAAEGLGAKGLLVKTASEVEPALSTARAAARSGQPVLLNVHIGRTDFRKGSISM